ncbi:MAG: pyridoxal-dependent decarboxylase [Myxococcales bacterium]|nr:pyridoxal-dependent decarboxylase [Myxococcales bacterium]
MAKRIFAALSANIRYESAPVMGLPGSILDREVFPLLPELQRHPLLSCFRENPNHIGCHTAAPGESAFRGTQEIELDLLRICAVEILGAEPGGYDGYVASGGTESNIQALWAFRNFFRRAQGAGRDEVAVLCSEDSHYSIHKAADLLDLRQVIVPVDPETRRMRPADVEAACRGAHAAGTRFFCVVLNMGTTMFGSIDSADDVLPILERLGLPYRAHVDAAFGGFIYPFVAKENPLRFTDQRLSSFTMDAHKILQAPYGTGIHLIRKGLIEYVCTDEATYVPGLDSTLSGSRSGTNAIAVWMILRAYGAEGGERFCRALARRTDRLCAELKSLGVGHYRHPHMNVIALRAEDTPRALAEKHFLVPDRHEGEPGWWKIVVMDHVTHPRITEFLEDARAMGAGHRELGTPRESV